MLGFLLQRLVTVVLPTLLGISIDVVRSEGTVPDGDHELRTHFAYDGGGVGTFDETVDIGCDLASPVSTDDGATGNAFSGALHKVRIELGDEEHSHLIDPEHRLQVAMLKQ